MIGNIYAYLVLLLPLVFYTGTNEAFEFSKLVIVYGVSILIGSLWAIKICQTKKVNWKKSALDIPLLLFIVSQIISTIFSIDPLTSIFGYYTRFNGGLLSTLSYALLYWAYVNNVTNNKQQKVIKYLIYSGVIVSVWAIFEKYGYSPSCLILNKEITADCWVQDVQTRVFATLGQPNWLAAYLVAIIPFVWQKDIKHKQSIFEISIYVVIFTALLFTKSRSGLVALLMIFIYFWLINYKDNIKFILKYAMLSFILILILGSAWNKALYEYFDVYQTKAVNNQELLITPSSEIRKLVWKGAIDVWSDNFWIGTGVETFGFSYYLKRPIEHNRTSEWNYTYNKAHNEFLNIAANSGIFGLFSFVLIILTVVYKNYRRKSEYIASYMGLLITAFFGFLVVNTSLLFFLIPAFIEINKNYTYKYKPRINVKTVIIGIMGLIAIFIIYRYWAADYYYHKFNKTNDVKYINKAIYLNRLNPEYKITLADYYASFGLVQESNQIVSIILYKNSNNLNLLKKGAYIYSDLSNFEPSYLNKEIEALKILTTKAPTDASIYYRLAIAYIKSGNIEEGINSLELAIKLKPNYEKAKVLYEYYRDI